MTAKHGIRSLGSLNVQEDGTIGVFGHYGNQNLGDEAIIQAVLQNLRRRRPKAKLIGFSSKPEDTAARFNIQAYPIRRSSQPCFENRSSCHQPLSNADVQLGAPSRHSWIKKAKRVAKSIPFLRATVAGLRSLLRLPQTLVAEVCFLYKSRQILKDVDLLIITGSNQFLDNFGGPWGFPYTLLKWSAMARITGTKVAYVCVGAGPVSSRLSKSMIKLALKAADYVSFRDLRSQKMIESFGSKCTTAVYPDLAYSLFLSPARDQRTESMDRKVTVGINPMPLFDRRYWCIDDADRYSNYIQKLATFAASLWRDGYPLVFWGTQTMDQFVIEDVLSRLESELGETVDRDQLVARPSSVDELLEVIAACDISVVTRFHGVVLPLWAGKPVLSVCYHQKMDDLMQEMGQSDYSVMFDSFDSDCLLKRFKQLEERYHNEVKKILRRTQAYRRALEEQYDLLFGAQNEVGGDASFGNGACTTSKEFDLSTRIGS